MKVRDRTKENLGRRNPRQKVVNNNTFNQPEIIEKTESTPVKPTIVEQSNNINFDNPPQHPKRNNNTFGSIALLLVLISFVIIVLALFMNALFFLFISIILFIISIIFSIVALVKNEGKVVPIISLITSGLSTVVVMFVGFIFLIIGPLVTYGLDVAEQTEQFDPNIDNNNGFGFGGDNNENSNPFGSDNDEEYFGSNDDSSSEDSGEYSFDFDFDEDSILGEQSTEEILEKELDVEIGEYKVENGRGYYEVSVTNKSDAPGTYEIGFTTDSYMDFVIIPSLEPGETVTKKIFVSSDSQQIEELKNSEIDIDHAFSFGK